MGRDGTSINTFTERWVGLENFERVLTSWDFWQALINTFGLFIFSAVPQLMLALILASLLNRRLRMNSVFRVGILVPYITPIVASSIVFSTFFARDGGQANWILSLFHVQTTYGNVTIDGIDWRNERWSAWLALVIMVDWKWTGYNALLYSGGDAVHPQGRLRGCCARWCWRMAPAVVHHRANDSPHGDLHGGVVNDRLTAALR